MRKEERGELTRSAMSKRTLTSLLSTLHPPPSSSTPALQLAEWGIRLSVQVWFSPPLNSIIVPMQNRLVLSDNFTLTVRQFQNNISMKHQVWCGSSHYIFPVLVITHYYPTTFSSAFSFSPGKTKGLDPIINLAADVVSNTIDFVSWAKFLSCQLSELKQVGLHNHHMQLHSFLPKK